MKKFILIGHVIVFVLGMVGCVPPGNLKLNTLYQQSVFDWHYTKVPDWSNKRHFVYLLYKTESDYTLRTTQEDFLSSDALP